VCATGARPRISENAPVLSTDASLPHRPTDPITAVSRRQSDVRTGIDPRLTGLFGGGERALATRVWTLGQCVQREPTGPSSLRNTEGFPTRFPRASQEDPLSRMAILGGSGTGFLLAAIANQKGGTLWTSL
jgi:hypothetical protein